MADRLRNPGIDWPENDLRAAAHTLHLNHELGHLYNHRVAEAWSKSEHRSVVEAYFAMIEPNIPRPKHQNISSVMLE